MEAHKIGLALVSSVGFALGSQAQAGLIIDNFVSRHSATVNIDGSRPFPQSGSSSFAAPSAIGMERDLLAVATGGTDDDRIRIRSNPGNFERLSLSLDDSVNGFAAVVWDGQDANQAINFIGLRSGGVGIDFTQGGFDDAIEFNIFSDDLPVTLTMTLWTDAANSAIGSVNLPGGIINVNTPVFLRYTDFTVAGAGFSFANIGAARIHLQGSQGLDMSMSFLGTVNLDPSNDPPPNHPVPVPASGLLLGLGVLLLGYRRV